MPLSSQRRIFIAIVCLVIAAAVAFVDQGIKNLIVQNFQIYEVKPFLGEVVKLTYVLNDSAAFSIGFGFTGIFTVISATASVTLIWFILAKSKSIGWSLMAAVLLGGVLGNLLDRFVRSPGAGLGKVVDYIQIPFNFPIFNLADIAIVSMAMLGALRILLGHSIGQSSKANDA